MKRSKNQPSIKKLLEELLTAKKYTEGRGIRIDGKDKGFLIDVLKLLEIKVEK